MISTALIRNALRATAVLNLTAGLSAVAFPALNARLLLAPGVVLDGLTLRYHWIVWLFVAAMGVGYAAASRDPARQTALVLCGGTGKLCAVAVWLEMLVHGYGAPLMWAGVAWDGALGALFLAYLATGPAVGAAPRA